LDAGMLIPLNENYKLFHVVHPTEEPPDVEVLYKFAHDRVQQAAYALLAEDERPATHLQIGQRLLQHLAPNKREEQLFAVVGHLNQGEALLDDPSERLELTRMNLRAARKARDSGAYAPAWDVLQAGLALLSQDCWTSHYDLTLSLHITAAEVAFLIGDLESMQDLLEQIYQHATTALDKALGQEIQIQAYLTQAAFGKAVEVMLEALEPLGVTFPAQPQPEDIEAALKQTMAPWLEQDVTALLELPVMDDPQQQAIMRLLTRTNPAGYISRPDLLPLMVCEQVQRSIAYGNAPSSPFVYSFFSILLSGAVGHVELGNAFSQVALKLVEQSQSQKYKCRSLYIDCVFIGHWLRPLPQVLKPVPEAYRAALEVGDLEFLGYAAYMHSCLSYWAGFDLDKVAQQAETYHQAILEYRTQSGRTYNRNLREAIANLQEELDEPKLVTDTFADQDGLLAELKQAKDHYGVFNVHLFTLQLHILFRKPQKAFHHMQECALYLDAAVGNITIPIFHFYASLARLGVYPQADEDTKEELLQEVSQAQEQMHQWAQNSPTNFLHRWHLVEAEKNRCLGDVSAAQKNYEEAIRLALKHRVTYDAALSVELAALFYRDNGQERLFHYSIRDAHHIYQDWGARTKTLALEKEYPALSHAMSGFAPLLMESSNSMSTSRTNEVLDLSSVLKASQSISSEIRLDRLLTSLMEIIIENAGAQMGYFLRKEDGQWQIKAKSHIKAVADEDTNAPAIPQTVLNYVSHSKQPLVLDNSMAESPFLKDPYIQTHQPKSIMCLPFVKQGVLLGLVYLENNLSTGAFPPERLHLLEMLSAQAAISLENAFLVQNLEDKVTERTQALQDALEKVETQYQQLLQTQTQLVQSEKMASLGTLVAGVAHEINNPVNFTYNGAFVVQKEVDKLTGLLQELTSGETEAMKIFTEHLDPINTGLGIVFEGSQRIKAIVSDLRIFSRLDEAEQKEADIVEGLKTTLSLIEGSYREQVDFVTDYRSNPTVLCWPGQLNQVFMNVMINACQAIQAKQEQQNEVTKGILTIRTKLKDELLEILFEDTGVGIPKEHIEKAFEPFFTTKDVGSGMGLGLSISYGIIEKHGGSIRLESIQGEGTTVIITLPLNLLSIRSDIDVT